MRESQADRNLALQDACSRGDEAAARKLMDGAETASVSRSLKKAGEKASTTILEMLLERLEREKALDRYDLAIALAWWAESESAGEEEERRRDEGLRRLAGLADQRELAWALRSAAERTSQEGVERLLSVGAKPEERPEWSKTNGTNDTPMETARRIAEMYGKGGEMKSRTEKLLLSLESANLNAPRKRRVL